MFYMFLAYFRWVDFCRSTDRSSIPVDRWLSIVHLYINFSFLLVDQSMSNNQATSHFCNNFNTLVSHDLLTDSAKRCIIFASLPSVMFSIRRYRRTTSVFCCTLHDFQPISPRVAIFEVFFPTPIKYLHALFWMTWTSLYEFKPHIPAP